MFYKNNTFGKLKKKKHEHRENGDMFQIIDGNWRIQTDKLHTLDFTRFTVMFTII